MDITLVLRAMRYVAQWLPAPARERLGIAAGAGMLAGAAALVPRYGWELLAPGITAGAVLGASLVCLLLLADAVPVVVFAVLLASAYPLWAVAQLAGFPALAALPSALAVPIMVWRVRAPENRRTLALNLLTAAVVVYAGFALIGQTATAPEALLAQAGSTALPVLGFLLAPLLGADERVRLLRVAVGALLAGAVTLVLLVGGAELISRGDAGYLAPLLSPALGHATALALVVLVTWDAPRHAWRLLLGPAPRWQRGLLAAGMALLGAGMLLGVALSGSRATLLALGLALLAAAMVSHRYEALVLLALLAVPLFGLLSGGWAPWMSAPRATVGLDGRAWMRAIAQAAETPFGAGFAADPASEPQLLATLRELGMPGLLAFLLPLALAFGQCLAVYRRLRRVSPQAGALLATLAALVFVFGVGVTSAPLREPGLAFIFWCLLGLAAPLLAGERAGAVAPDADTSRTVRRAHPLRVAYVLHSAESAFTTASLLDLFATLDRRRVLPLLTVIGDDPLAEHARGLEVSTRVVERVAVAGQPVAHLLAASPLGVARWLAGLAPMQPVLHLTGEGLRVWGNLREWQGLLCAVLDQQPDLIVSCGSGAHLPSLCVGRLAGVPVQWHAREYAPATRQPLLDAFAPWTAGVVAASQAVARSFALERLRAWIKVVRPGILPPEPLPGAQRAALRAAAGCDNGALLAVVAGPVTAESGHLELLEALPHALDAIPSLRVICAWEALPGTEDATLGGRALRLRHTLAMRDLAARVEVRGGQADFPSLLAAADLAIFPQRRSPGSRELLMALAVGIPILAVDAGALPEQLAEAWGSLLVPAGEPEALRGGLLAVLADLPRYQEAARRHPGLVRDWFTAYIEAVRLQSLYHRAVLSRPRLVAWWPFRARRWRYPMAWQTYLATAEAEA